MYVERERESAFDDSLEHSFHVQSFTSSFSFGTVQMHTVHDRNEWVANATTDHVHVSVSRMFYVCGMYGHVRVCGCVSVVLQLNHKIGINYNWWIQIIWELVWSLENCVSSQKCGYLKVRLQYQHTNHTNLIVVVVIFLLPLFIFRSMCVFFFAIKIIVSSFHFQCYKCLLYIVNVMYAILLFSPSFACHIHYLNWRYGCFFFLLLKKLICTSVRGRSHSSSLSQYIIQFRFMFCGSAFIRRNNLPEKWKIWSFWGDIFHMDALEQRHLLVSPWPTRKNRSFVCSFFT